MKIKYIELESTDSTNEYIKKVDFDLSDIIVVTSKFQTTGKGSKGRSFYSPIGGLYFSIKIKSEIISNFDLITLYCAVALCNALNDSFKINAEIKWINDIYLENRKISGILCESQNFESIIIGIGVNILSDNNIPKDIENKIGFIENYSNEKFSNKAIIDKFLFNLLELYKLNKNFVVNEYKKLSYTLHKKMIVKSNNSIFEAKAVDIDDKGNLLVQKSNGEKVKLNSSSYSTEIIL